MYIFGKYHLCVLSLLVALITGKNIRIVCLLILQCQHVNFHNVLKGAETSVAPIVSKGVLSHVRAYSIIVLFHNI
jgi:hypothetical protein